MDLTERYERFYTGVVYDAMRELGHRDCILPQEIRPIDPALSVAGRVWTCSGVIDESVSDDESLISWTGLLSAAPANSVIVCQPNDSTLAHMGELSAETLKYRGVRGYIVDGGNRDTDFILKLGWPVFCRYLTPSDVVGHWRVDSMGAPITIGGLTVQSGDYVVADIDGVVVVPAELAEQIADRAEELINTEDQLRTMILSGTDPHQAYLKYRMF